jgi:uncharacterized membrane protein
MAVADEQGTGRVDMLIRMPPAWGIEKLRDVFGAIGTAAPDEYFPAGVDRRAVPRVRRIGLGEVGQALALGWRDFVGNRTDVLFLCIIYPIAGLLFWALAAGNGMLQLIFPLASGFALVGPLAAIGLYEMSRRREAGREVSWLDGFAVLRSPAIGTLALLGVMLLLVLGLWLVTAQAIYDATLGPEPPASLAALAADLTGRAGGRTMMVAGIAAGAAYAAVVFVLTVVSFPLLLDRDVSLATALQTSLEVVRLNPGPMLAWAAIVVGGLVLGSIPLLVGLAVTLPVLGHATWHLYRAVVF